MEKNECGFVTCSGQFDVWLRMGGHTDHAGSLLGYSDHERRSEWRSDDMI